VTTTPSWDLVAAAQDGDKDSFAALYRRHLPVVTRFVRLRIRDRHLAEDLTSETFLRAFRALGSAHDQGSDVGAWLVTIARNLIYDHGRSLRSRLEVVGLDVAALAELTPHTGPGVEHTVLAQLDLDEVGRRVATLFPDQRAVIALRFGYDLPVADTATVLDRSPDAVKALTHRAVTALRAGEVAA
jgi:RNA polymerase sigma-70 factor, ECF subfamily